MILTGGMIDAEEAHRIGLVNAVLPPEELMSGALALAKKILRNGPIAVRYALEAVNRGATAGLAEGLAMEQQLFGLINATVDVKEGLSAFLEKRKAEFRGE